ncbi:MAG: hypothetical protein ABR515_02650 [Nitrososphaeraceae archaeon]
MNTRTIIAMFLIAASIGMATTSLTIPISADKSDAREGLDKADEKVHDNTGGLSDQDVRFHEGICQGDHSTTVLDELLEGCDALDNPGGK